MKILAEYKEITQKLSINIVNIVIIITHVTFISIKFEYQLSGYTHNLICHFHLYIY